MAILNKQHNQLMIHETQHYQNLCDMVLATINMISKETKNKDKTGVEFTNFPNVNMHNLEWVLQNLGYSDGDLDTNGWEMDFWENFLDAPDGFPQVQLSGTGATGEVILQGYYEDENQYKPLEQNKEYKDRIKKGNALLTYYIKKIREENERVGMLYEE